MKADNLVDKRFGRLLVIKRLLSMVIRDGYASVIVVKSV